MIVFFNPHHDDFLAEPVKFRLLKRRALKKYGWIFEEIISSNQKINVLLSDHKSSLIPPFIFQKFPKYIRRIIVLMEYKVWVKINFLEGHLILHRDTRQLDRSHALWMFAYKTALNPIEAVLPLITHFSVAFVHLSHYMIRTKEKADNLQKLTNLILVGDSDITENAYFREFFSWYQKPMAVLPFCVQKRFQNVTPFAAREKMCIATGSFHNLAEESPSYYYEDFIGFFKTTTYHPIRKLLYSNRDTLSAWLTCHVSPYHGATSTQSSIFLRLFSRFVVSQKKYFSLDLVKEYNRHRYVIVGEELNGFPALGAFEAMACGAVLIADSPDYYKGLGMEEGIHYVCHDGSLEGIRNIVESLNRNPDKAEKLSQEGMALINSKFRSCASYQQMLEFINRKYGRE